MANSKSAVSFDEIIQAGRKKRQAEELAQQIFGKNRRSSTPTTGRNGQAGGSLASRVGVNKRSSSTASNSRLASSRPGGPPRGPSQLSRGSRTTASAPERSMKAQNNLQSQTTPLNGSGPELSIRGAAGPYCVVAQNFAPGTTALDIESVMIPVGGEMESCRLIPSKSTVMVEMMFFDKAGAENVIATFNNKKADGRVLYVQFKQGGPSRIPSPRDAPEEAPVEPSPAKVDDVIMSIDEVPSSNGRDRRDKRGERDLFARTPRDDRDYRDDYPREPRRSEPAFQDGRYGFGGPRSSPRDGPRYGRDDRRGGYGDGGGMYSDGMMRRGGGGRGGGGGGGGREGYRPR